MITKIIQFGWGENPAFFVFKNVSTILTKKTAQNRCFENFEKRVELEKFKGINDYGTVSEK